MPSDTEMETTGSSRFCERLKTQRFIQLYIGEEQEGPFFIQQAVLDSASEWFTAAIRRGDTMGNEPGILRFPDDDKEAWKILLWWMFNPATRPDFAEFEGDCEFDFLRVQCWILGDKYMIHEFQDVIMHEMLYHVDGGNGGMATGAIVHAFQHTGPDSPLRRLVAEIAVTAIYATEILPASFLDHTEGAVGVASSIAGAVRKAQARCPPKQLDAFGYFGDRVWNDSEAWKDFMVCRPAVVPYLGAESPHMG